MIPHSSPSRFGRARHWARLLPPLLAGAPALLAQTPHVFPVPASKVILGLEWTAPETKYPLTGDTYPMTWAADGEIYASSGDPDYGPNPYGLDMNRFKGFPPNYTITQTSPMIGYTGKGGRGPKPTGMISVKGVLYLAYQNMNGATTTPFGRSQSGADAAITASRDSGKTWTPTLADYNKVPMFPGYKFGGPAFVNFGKDNAGARDEYVYAISTEQWDNGNSIRLGRVHQDSILRKESWSFVVKMDTVLNKPTWGKQLDSAVPVLSDPRWISLPDMTYLKEIKRYLLLTWRFKQDFNNKEGSHLIIYESPEPWGPFRLVHHDTLWENSKAKTPYCPHVPLKWWDGKTLSGWLQFSGAWRSPEYASHVRPFKLKMAAGTSAVGKAGAPEKKRSRFTAQQARGTVGYGRGEKRRNTAGRPIRP